MLGEALACDPAARPSDGPGWLPFLRLLAFTASPCPSLPRQASSPDSFEDRIVALCKTMMCQACWLRSETLVPHVSFRGMTLLHLAAAQGYTHLIETLIKWR